MDHLVLRGWSVRGQIKDLIVNFTGFVSGCSVKTVKRYLGPPRSELSSLYMSATAGVFSPVC